MSHSDIESLELFMVYMVLLCFLAGFMGLFVATVVRSVYRWVDRRYIFFPAAARAFRRRAAARREVVIRVQEGSA